MLVLHKLVSILKLDQKEGAIVKEVITLLLLFNKTNKDTSRLLKFTFLISIITLRRDNVWFIKNLRDNNLYPLALFDLQKCALGFFISIFMSNILNQSLFKKKQFNSINLFLSEPSSGLNSYGESWKDLVTYMIEYSDPKLILNSLVDLLDMYNIMEENEYYLNDDKQHIMMIEDSKLFNQSYIIDSWLEILLFSKYFNLNESDIEFFLNKLSDDFKKLLVNTLSRNWIIDNQLNTKYKIKFLKYFDISPLVISKKNYNKNILETLIKYKNKFYKEQYKKKFHNNSTNISELKFNVERNFKESIKNNDFLDKTIDLSMEKPIFFRWVIEKDNFKSLFDFNPELIENSLAYLFRKEIESFLKPVIIKKRELTHEQIKIIKELGPTNHSYLNVISDNFLDDLKINNENTSLINNKLLPLNFFYKKEAIKINAEYDDHNSCIRILTEKEIDDIIDKKYQLVNGLYRYSENSEDIATSFLVSNEELKKILKERLLYVSIAIKKKIVINNKECLWFKLK